LKRLVGGDKIIVVGDPALRQDLSARYDVAVQEVDGALHFHVAGGAEFVPRVAVDFKGRIQSIQVKRPTLDDVFLKLTGHAIPEQEGSELDRMRQASKLWTGRR
jgi:ABC-2 type transport system ATP-binding protein